MDNRQAILDSALTLFYEKGYDAVGVQQIVDAAGVTKPTLYYYFGSKQGLLSCFKMPWAKNLSKFSLAFSYTAGK